MKKLVGSVGPWVSDKQFWGREHEKILLAEHIKEGNHVSIIAQRRIGKTSLMHEVGRTLGSEYIVLHIDVQDATSIADVVVKIVSATRSYQSIWGRVHGIFNNIFSSVKDNIESISITEVEILLRAGMAGDAWREKGSAALAVLANADKPVVIFIDELPILINKLLEKDKIAGKEHVHDLLSWLRAEALKPELHKKVSMVFAGSIGLEPVLKSVGLTSEINHLLPFMLRPWSNEEAFGCLQALAAHRSLNLSNDACQQMLTQLGCNIPHHVQLFFAKVREYVVKHTLITIDTATVSTIFEQEMLGTSGHVELTHMETRLAMVLSTEELTLATELLTQTAIKGSIDLNAMKALWDRHKDNRNEMTQTLQGLFEIFEHDGYLQKNSKAEYVFVSNLLRQWWKARHEAFFEPV